MSYSISERVSNLKTALDACTLIRDFDPDASQRELGQLYSGEPRAIWVSHKVSVEDCTDFEIVVEGNRAIFAPFKLLAEGVPIYPAGHSNLADFTVLPHLKDKHPELLQQLLAALKGIR